MKNKAFLQGMRDGLPIGLGYFAVSFSLGIIAKNAGLTPFQGFIASLLNLASAGEYALFTSMQALASYLEIAAVIFVVNARYMLMSCALSQKFNPKTKLIHRLLVGFAITDELFGITISREGYITPSYNYGAYLIAVPLWCFGTSFGIIAGNFLPARIVSALSVALYGMFLAIIVPPAKKSPVIMVSVIVSFVTSYLSTITPFIKNLSAGTRTIILTVIISSVVALVKPIPETENVKSSESEEKK